MPKPRAKKTKPTPTGKSTFDLRVFLETAARRGKQRRSTLQGDPAKGVKYIQEGGVKLSIVNEDCKEAVVAILGPGDFFGEGCLAQTVCMGSATDPLSYYSLIKRK
jgi:CRP/FNR family cyclic AMP-dependent transcriptional regulator